MKNTTPSALAELLPPLAKFEASIEANRCLYCYDAPCVQACPTHIDIPGFIRKIAQDRPRDAAKTILADNLMGASCSRVCPVKELCEGACVMNASSIQPIAIGRLQRYATDTILHEDKPVFPLAKSSGKKVAVVGAGPAGLSCAGTLSQLGHQVEVFEKRDLPGGLSTYGIVGLREPVDVSLAEVALVERLGVKVHRSQELGLTFGLEDLSKTYDAVFLAAGLGKVPTLGIPGEEHIIDGLAFLETSKMAPHNLKPGKEVLVLGAGNTAIDCATIAKRAGAKRVTLVYRRTEAEMSAYEHEYEFAKSEGLEFRFLSQPAEVMSDSQGVKALRCQVMELGEPDASGRPSAVPVTGSWIDIPADMIISALGQEKPSNQELAGLARSKGYLAVDESFQTSKPGVFAGGDMIRASGAASTVMAVQDGKLAARAINQWLLAGKDKLNG